MTLLALICALTIAQAVAFSEIDIQDLITEPIDENNQYWQLENYNDWNLPFAKTVEIKGRSGGKFTHTLPGDTYKMEVDPSALFSILFLDKDQFTDYSEDDLVNLEYEFLGNESLLGEIQGVWTDVTMLIMRDAYAYNGKNYTANVTIFVALGDSADAGLDGTLALAVAPVTDDWQSVSVMAQLENQYNWPAVYQSYKFVYLETQGIYFGYIYFSKTSDDVGSMTYGGQTVIQDQIGYDNIFGNKTVNPFLSLDLTQIYFRDVLLQENQIFVTNFDNTISLIPSSAATHIPKSIYDYMQKNFFDYICVSPGEGNNKQTDTSLAVPLSQCQCDGLNYYGMPGIQFSLSIDQYSTKFAYLMEPEQFEMLPKVDTKLRTAECALGLWNLQNTKDSASQYDINEFAVGQNFIRTYNMTLKFVKRSQQGSSQQGGEISLTMFIGNATHEDSIFKPLMFMLLTGGALLTYLGIFTLMKFRRVRNEKVEFDKIQIGMDALSVEEAKKLLTTTQQEAEFIEGKAQAQSLQHQVFEQMRQREEQKKATQPLPFRRTQSFVNKRVKAFDQTMAEQDELKQQLLLPRNEGQ